MSEIKTLHKVNLKTRSDTLTTYQSIESKEAYLVILVGMV